MSEEEINALNENLKQLNETMTIMVETMGSVTNQSKLTSRELGKLKTSVKDTDDAIDDLKEGSVKTKGALNNLTESGKKYEKQQDAIRDATGLAMRAVTGFGDALLSTEKGLSKYSGSLNSAGSAVSALSIAGGPLVKVFGKLFQVGMLVAGEWLKQTDLLLSYSDSISKMGAANVFTAEDIRQMGKTAGLTSETLGKLITPLTNLGPASRALGGSAEQATKAFAAMNETTAKTRKDFLRLGLDDEERIQATADYVSLLYKSNTYLSVQQRTGDALAKQAKAYTENLYVLAELTGADIKTAKEQLEVAKATMLWKLQENKWAQEQIRLEQAGDTAGLARLAAEREGAEKMMSDLAVINDPVITAAMQMKFLTGATTELAQGLIIAGVDIDGMVASAKNNTNAQGELVDHITDSQQNMINTMGHEVFGLSEELRNATNINEGSMDRMYRQTILASEGLNHVALAAGAVSRILSNEQGEGPVATDTPQIARGVAVEAERTAQLIKDGVIAGTNPLLNGLNLLTGSVGALTIAVGAATLALTAMTVSRGLGGLSGRRRPGSRTRTTTPRARVPRGQPGAGQFMSNTQANRMAARTAGTRIGAVGAVAGAGMSVYQGTQTDADIRRRREEGEITTVEARRERGTNIGGTSGEVLGTAGGAVAGAKAGALLGAMTGPAAPFFIPLGGLIGAGLGAWAFGSAGRSMGEALGETIATNTASELENEIDGIEIPVARTSTPERTEDLIQQELSQLERQLETRAGRSAASRKAEDRLQIQKLQEELNQIRSEVDELPPNITSEQRRVAAQQTRDASIASPRNVEAASTVPTPDQITTRITPEQQSTVTPAPQIAQNNVENKTAEGLENMTHELASRLERVIYLLDNGNAIQEKLYRINA
jgi:hypothetical protein